jgi:hypothetical protein
MDSLAVQRSRREGPRLFEGPVVFRRSRLRILELLALAWLLARLAGSVRSFLAARAERRDTSAIG